MKTIVWLAIILTGIAIAIMGVALFAYQEYRLVGNYGAYSISVRARVAQICSLDLA